MELDPHLLERLRAHLLHFEKNEDEQVAFLFSEPYEGDGCLRLKDIYLVPPEQFDFQSGYHVSLTDEARKYLIQRAWADNACLVEAHSHPGPGQVYFSGSDLRGFEDWVPHLWWRLKRRPYAAMVFGYESFDAVAWSRPLIGRRPWTGYQCLPSATRSRPASR